MSLTSVRGGVCLGIVLSSALLAGGCNSSSSDSVVEITSAPQQVDVPEATARLTATLSVQTNIPASLDINASDGAGHQLSKQFSAVASNQEITVLGFRPGRTYEVTVGATAPNGQRTEWEDPVTVTTESLPDDFASITLVVADTDAMSPGFTLLDAAPRDFTKAYTIIVDDEGEVVWYRQSEFISITDKLPTGNLLSLISTANEIQEINMRGELLLAWHASQSTTGSPGSIPVDAMNFHHDITVIEGEDRYLTIAEFHRTVDDFPIDEFDETQRATVTVRDDPIIEFDGMGNVIQRWNFLDIIDPLRIGYDGTRGLPDAADWAHANAVVHDPSDNSIIASLRSQDALIKFSRDSGELIWILGNHRKWTNFPQYLIAPIGSPFVWQYHQHAPMLTPDGTILLYDNANHQATPFTGEIRTPPDVNFSRAVEYRIDEQAGTIEQVWEYGFDQSGELIYTPVVGDADLLSDSNTVLITFGGICNENGTPSNSFLQCRSTARIVEVTHEAVPRKVFEIHVDHPDPASVGYVVYRADRFPDLYGPGL